MKLGNQVNQSFRKWHKHYNVVDWLVWGPPPSPPLNNFSLLNNWPFFCAPPLNNFFEYLFLIDFNLLSIEINLLSIDFNLLLIDFNLLSIDFNLLSIDFNLLSIDFNLLSIDFNLLSIDFNLLSIEINWFSTDFNFLLIDFNLLSIDFQLISIYFQGFCFFSNPKVVGHNRVPSKHSYYWLTEPLMRYHLEKLSGCCFLIRV